MIPKIYFIDTKGLDSDKMEEDLLNANIETHPNKNYGYEELDGSGEVLYNDIIPQNC